MISPHDIAESYSKLPQDVSSQKLLSEKNIYGSSQLMNMMSLLGKTYFSQVDTSNEEMTQLSNIYYDRSISAAVVEVIPDIKPQNGSSNVFNKQVRMNIDVIGNETKTSISYKGLSEDVKPGSTILVDDGAIEFRVDEIVGKDVVCTALNTGKLGSRKTVNVPGLKLNLPALSEKDINDLTKEEFDNLEESF